jgi:hypothetical protein
MNVVIPFCVKVIRFLPLYEPTVHPSQPVAYVTYGSASKVGVGFHEHNWNVWSSAPGVNQ